MTMARAASPRAGRRRRSRKILDDEPIAGGVGTIRTRPLHEDPYWTGLYAKMLKESLCLFARDILELQIPDHVIEWGEFASTHDRIALLAAREHGKSAFWTYAYPIWRAVMEPGCEIFLFARTHDQAVEYLDHILYGIRNLKGMANIPSLAHLVPDGARKRNAGPLERKTRTDVRLRNGSRIRVAGYGKAVRGAHPKYVVCDDVLNDEDMFSETVRKKNITYFQSAISQMPPADGGQIIVVGTPYHIADLYGWLRQNEVYKFKVYAGIQKCPDGKERALFPFKWTLAQLRKKKKEIGPVAFAREILCEPITDDISVFPSHLFPPLYDTTITLRPKKSVIQALGLQIYMGVDLAISANVGADYTCIFVIGRDEHGNHYIVDIQMYKGFGFKRQLELIERAARRYEPNLIFMEANQFQKVFSDEMIRTTDLPIKPFITSAQNKYPLDKGVPGLRILLENGKIIIPRGDVYSVTATDTWIGESTQFGFIDGKLQGIGEHDDTVMAWWMATEACKAGGFSFAMGDEESTAEDGTIFEEQDDGDDSWKYEMGLEGDDSEEDDTPEDEDYDDDDDATGGLIEAFNDSL